MAKYPRYNIKNFTIEDCRDLFAEADDREFNQVRVSEEGEVYISTDTKSRNSRWS
jgi:hypothetical protein